MLIANEKDVEIIMHANPLVIGTRQGEGHNDLWKIPLPSAEELTNNNNALYNLWHNDDNNNDQNNNIPIPPAEIKAMSNEEILNRVNHLKLSAYNQKNAKDLVEFLHACAGYPVIETCIKATKKGFYLSWPKLD